ncbi:D-2-hydroxyglutarate dehydrogenase [Lunatimonas lonarensis]|uniref:D-2-hydroxyglutarate dehydrogenase n=1 Tax=Lunatimonas lonarensis TaxID=1232681 RepID=R7ZST1_9BACT|nr:D-2-hydroxyglutarate dehydrogenase [Lunatimonas lonarensis]
MVRIAEIVGADNLLVGDAVSERFVHIWKTHIPLAAVAVVTPTSVEQVSAVMRYCHQTGLSVVVHGGLTNMVGSTETSGIELVISMEKMNRILELDVNSKTAFVEAGVILEHLQEEVKKVGLMFPVTFGAKGSAQVGGMIATNAGGLRVFRYGMTRQWVLGLEVVMSDGTVISGLKKLVKDNSGLDLKQLFIGSEGVLGIITRAVLRLSPASGGRHTAFVALEDFGQVLVFLRSMELTLGGALTAFELIWKDTYQRMCGVLKGGGIPLAFGYPLYVLLEISTSTGGTSPNLLEQLLEKYLEEGIVLDAAVASSESEQNRFWRIREDVDHLVSQCTFDQHFDVSLPIADIGDYVDGIRRNLDAEPGVDTYFVYGHMADGNIHVVVSKKYDSVDLIERVNNLIYSPLTNYGGSISAEHGIGTHKKAYLPYCRSKEELDLMRRLKGALDPKGILNPGKII